MKSISFVVMAMMLFLGSAAWAAPQLVVCQDLVVISEPVHAGETIQGVFKLCNEGDTLVRIKRVAPS